MLENIKINRNKNSKNTYSYSNNYKSNRYLTEKPESVINNTNPAITTNNKFSYCDVLTNETAVDKSHTKQFPKQIMVHLILTLFWKLQMTLKKFKSYVILITRSYYLKNLDRIWKNAVMGLKNFNCQLTLPMN